MFFFPPRHDVGWAEPFAASCTYAIVAGEQFRPVVPTVPLSFFVEPLEMTFRLFIHVICFASNIQPIVAARVNATIGPGQQLLQRTLSHANGATSCCMLCMDILKLPIHLLIRFHAFRLVMFKKIYSI